MTTFKPKQRKALWYRATHGEAPKPRTIRRIRPVSKRRSRLSRIYAARAEAWKVGRACVCSGLRDSIGRLICFNLRHACEDVHHLRGRVGLLLLDERFWLPVCRRAHNWIGEHISQARSRGLLCEVGEWGRVPNN